MRRTSWRPRLRSRSRAPDAARWPRDLGGPRAARAGGSAAHRGRSRRLELMPELRLVPPTSGELALAERISVRVHDRRWAGGEIVTLAAQIERAALRLRSDPRGWEHDLDSWSAALPSLEAAADSDRSVQRALGRGWFLVGLVRGLWAGQLALGEEALSRAIAHARAAGDRRQEAEIVAGSASPAWSGPMPVSRAIERCNDLLVGAGTTRSSPRGPALARLARGAAGPFR